MTTPTTPDTPLPQVTYNMPDLGQLVRSYSRSDRFRDTDFAKHYKNTPQIGFYIHAFLHHGTDSVAENVVSGIKELNGKYGLPEVFGVVPIYSLLGFDWMNYGILAPIPFSRKGILAINSSSDRMHRRLRIRKIASNDFVGGINNERFRTYIHDDKQNPVSIHYSRNISRYISQEFHAGLHRKVAAPTASIAHNKIKEKLIALVDGSIFCRRLADIHLACAPDVYQYLVSQDFDSWAYTHLQGFKAVKAIPAGEAMISMKGADDFMPVHFDIGDHLTLEKSTPASDDDPAILTIELKLGEVHVNYPEAFTRLKFASK